MTCSSHGIIFRISFRPYLHPSSPPARAATVSVSPPNRTAESKVSETSHELSMTYTAAPTVSPGFRLTPLSGGTQLPLETSSRILTTPSPVDNLSESATASSMATLVSVEAEVPASAQAEHAAITPAATRASPPLCVALERANAKLRRASAARMGTAHPIGIALMAAPFVFPSGRGWSVLMATEVVGPPLTPWALSAKNPRKSRESATPPFCTS